MCVLDNLPVGVIHEQDRRRARRPPRRHVVDGVANHDEPRRVRAHRRTVVVALPSPLPLLGNVQDASGRGFGGLKVARDDGRKRRVGEELGQKVVNGYVEVAGANGFGDAARVEVPHEDVEARLRRLLGHGGALDALDGSVRRGLLRGGERVHVVDDVDSLGDAKGGTHLAKHVVLGFTKSSVHVEYDALQLGCIGRAPGLERRESFG